MKEDQQHRPEINIWEMNWIILLTRKVLIVSLIGLFATRGWKDSLRRDFSRINQSIEAFVYCVLGAQVNVRSSILGDGGQGQRSSD